MFWRRNGLSITVGALALLFLCGQVLAGHAAYNEELARAQQPLLGIWAYLHTGHFVSATFENWESEFLQMGMYVLLTVKLRQVGSAESRPLEPEAEDSHVDPGPVPWPVRAGGVWYWLYSHSLSVAFGLLFSMSFLLHLAGSWRAAVAQHLREGLAPVSLWQHFTSADFWFESMQNWQSEFLAVLSLVVLTIWLREKDSPQSKPVQAPHAQTGD